MNYNNINTEKYLSTVLILIASFMLYLSFSFQDNVAVFPQLTATVVVLGSILVLFKSKLPKKLRRLVSDTSALIEVDEETYEQTDDGASASEKSASQFSEENSFYLQYRQETTFILLALYIFMAYLLGFLIASPVFVGIYTLVMKQSWRVIAITVALSFIIVNIFMVVLDVPVDRGLLFPGVTW